MTLDLTVDHTRITLPNALELTALLVPDEEMPIITTRTDLVGSSTQEIA